MIKRFTIDGSPELEKRLEQLCDQVREGITAAIPSKEIEAIVLGGGYGRGEGGVLREVTGDKPYNDLEFYVFLRGNRVLNDRRYRGKLHELGERLSVGAEMAVEFKIDCIDRWMESAVTMFSYDLVAGHRIIFGNERILDDCGHHLLASDIPLSEATRLMFNRCSGLLMAREMLDKRHLTRDEANFIGRNMAKLQLALGDAVLTAFGEYHWSVCERDRRLVGLDAGDMSPWMAEIRAHHLTGTEFKLHPKVTSKSVEEFEVEHRQLTALARRLWLWLESRRLKQSFESVSEYALSTVEKCPETSSWRNFLLSIRTFGFKAFSEASSFRYPRERLFNALALLLWDVDVTSKPRLLRRLQQLLHTDAPDWAGLVGVFKRVWPAYG